LQYVFGDLTLDLGRRELRRGGAVIGIQPQVFDLLVYLVENRHQVVSKDDLIATVWQGRIVSDSTLTSRINAARKAVGDSGETQTLIRTISRKGVRFVGDVRVQSDAREPGPKSPAPESGKTDSPIPPAPGGHRQERARSRTWGGVFAGSLVAAALTLLFYQFGLPLAGAPKQPNVVEGEAASPTGMIAVAVLPFQNLSADREQEFFSDGITEEITSVLARIPNLHVVARTSAFEFKGSNRNIQEIAQALHATHVIEGSVRKVDDQVRVTAQLVQADNGLELWTDSYDRRVVNIFAIQDEIAQAIAGALRVPLGLQHGETLIANRTDNLNSYEQYLRARAFYRARDIENAIRILEPLVVHDPTFAPGWSLLAQVYAFAEWSGVDFGKAADVAHQAIRLNPRNALAYAALAAVDSAGGRFAESEAGFRKALALDPSEPDVIDMYSLKLGTVGRINEALSIRHKLHELEPFVPAYFVATARFMISAGQSKAALAILEKIPPEAKVSEGLSVALARAYAMEERYAEAANALLAAPPTNSFTRRSVEDAVRLLRSIPGSAGSSRNLPALEGRLNFVYAHVGALDRVLENPERIVQVHGQFDTSLDALWTPDVAPLRQTERFKKFVRASGLYDYWREHGWADVCRPAGADDFVCD